MADVLQLYGRDDLHRFGQDLLPSHRPAMADMLRCRTEALGGQLLPCDHCGQAHYVYHACRHRSCPKCHRTDTEVWLEERRHEILLVPYFHVVFILPQELQALVRCHQQDLYEILRRAAAKALRKLAADTHDVRGLIGVLCVLHTWSRTLAYPPHVHCLVPAGGVSADRTEWRPAHQSYLVPTHEFICRFLPHVLPQGFHNVRYYGLWSPVHCPLLHQLQLRVVGHPPHPLPAAPEPEKHPTDSWGRPSRAGQPCPGCGQGLLVVIRSLPRLLRGPP